MKNAILNVRITSEDRATMTAAARLANETLSQWVRRVLLAAVPVDMPAPVDRAALAARITVRAEMRARIADMAYATREEIDALSDEEHAEWMLQHSGGQDAL